MDFETLNPTNCFINNLTGNFLPVTDKKTSLPATLRIYSIVVWIIELTHFTACIAGTFHVPRDRVLQDSTVSTVVSIEVIVLYVHLYTSTNLLRRLIEGLNRSLASDSGLLRSITVDTVKLLERPLKIYTIASVSSLAIWTLLPLWSVFTKSEFYYTDYRIPAMLSREPFSVYVFVTGVLLQVLGSGCTMMRKISLDVYMMHLILLMTAQYRYIRIKFASILGRDGNETAKRSMYGVTRQSVSEGNENLIKREMRILMLYYEAVIEMTFMLKKILWLNVAILHIDNVFRFCFLSFMFVTSPGLLSEKFLILLYTIGALTQFYILCYCIQGLLEASQTLADDAFHEKWYCYGIPLQRLVCTMVMANKLECRLSRFRNVDLTLPSFMTILNQAYSVCLFFLEARRG